MKAKTGKATIEVKSEVKHGANICYDIYERSNGSYTGWHFINNFRKPDSAKKWAKENCEDYCIIKLEFPA